MRNGLVNLTGSLFVVGYLVGFLALVAGSIWWDRRKRRTKPPFPENLKLLRMPGEYLWRRVIEADEADMQWGLLVVLAPIVAGEAMLYLGGRLFHLSPSANLVVALVVFVFLVFACARWYRGRLRRRADDYLGFFGERYVGEWLEPLKAQGWFLFHDVPCAGIAGKFNLDHVAVGPGGILGG